MVDLEKCTVSGTPTRQPAPVMNESANCFIHWEEIELSGYGPNYGIELSELKPNVNLHKNLILQNDVLRTSGE
jgi:hypothetical protein